MGPVEEDRQRWDDRYKDQDRVDPAPPEALRDRGDLLAIVPAAGRALDIACGRGAAALWAAQRGLHVLALDVSPLAVGKLRSAANEAGLDERIEARVVDLDDGLPDDATGFALVICQRFRDPRLYGPLFAALAPGGMLVVTVLSEVGATETGPYHAPAGELQAAFTRPGAEVLRHEEGGGVASIVVQLAP
jgi:SAM-dependent methyltransferase